MLQCALCYLLYRTGCSSGFRCRPSLPPFPQYGPVASQLATKHAAVHGQCLKCAVRDPQLGARPMVPVGTTAAGGARSICPPRPVAPVRAAHIRRCVADLPVRRSARCLEGRAGRTRPVSLLCEPIHRCQCIARKRRCWRLRAHVTDRFRPVATCAAVGPALVARALV